MKILAFDTSNKSLSVAVVDDGKAVAHIESTENKTHSITLLPDIERSLDEAHISVDDIDRIAVADGPGSYTGVRIAVTVAKTLAFTLGKPLIGVSSLQLLAANGDAGKLCVPLMDARNDNAYAGIYSNEQGKITNIVEDQHITMTKLLELLQKYDEDKLEFINATPRLTDLIREKYSHAQIMLEEDSLPDAVKLAKLAESMEPIKDIDSFVPTYLRLTQAEYDWYEKGHKDDGNISYVEEV